MGIARWVVDGESTPPPSMKEEEGTGFGIIQSSDDPAKHGKGLGAGHGADIEALVGHIRVQRGLRLRPCLRHLDLLAEYS